MGGFSNLAISFTIISVLTGAVLLYGASPELDKALDAVRRAQADAVIVFPEGATMANRAALARFAMTEKLPSMFGWSEYVDAGGLMSYGASQRDPGVAPRARRSHRRLTRCAERRANLAYSTGP